MKKVKKSFLFLSMLLMCFAFSTTVCAASVKEGSQIVRNKIRDENGKVIKAKKSYVIVRLDDDLYAVNKKGSIVKKKYFTIGSKLYCARSNGKLYRNVTSEGITFKSSGAAENDYPAKLKKQTMKIVKRVFRHKKSKSARLRAVWNYLTKGGRFHYVGKHFTKANDSRWYFKAAYQMFRTRRGDCTDFAAAFAALAKEVGYRPVMVYGKAKYPGRNLNLNHMWVVINHRYYDPERAAVHALGQSYNYGYRMKKYNLIRSVRKKYRFPSKA